MVGNFFSKKWLKQVSNFVPERHLAVSL